MYLESFESALFGEEEELLRPESQPSSYYWLHYNGLRRLASQSKLLNRLAAL